MTQSFEPLSSMDAAILGIEDKTNLMMVSGAAMSTLSSMSIPKSCQTQSCLLVAWMWNIK